MASVRPIYINGRFVTQPMTGVQRYAHEVSRRLKADKVRGGVENSGIEILVPKARQMGRMTANLWEQVNLLSQSHRGILFSPGNVGPWLHPRQLLTIHDIGVYDIEYSYSKIYRTWVRASMQALTRTAKQITTVSQYSKARILSKFKISPEKITIVYPGADHILDIEPDINIIRTLGLESRRYVLAVGSLAPHKNLSILGTVDWNRLGIKLCVVGSRNNKVFQRQANSGYQSNADSIIFTGRKTDAELRALYMHGLVYVFPSIYEGFGTPPLEAMHCGCPVIASNTTSIPEVCGDGALYFDPETGMGLQENLERIISEAGLREQMVARGYARAAQFQWDSTARSIFKLLKNMQEN